MKFPVFRKLAALAAFALCVAAPLPGQAQAPWPARPITIVVPYSPSGSTDALARILGQKVSAELGQPVVVENKAGAGSNIGVGFVAKAPPDGYTIGLATSTALSANPGLYRNLPFDPEGSFEPILLATILPSVLVVNAALKVDTLQQLNAYLMQPGTQASYASSGSGTAPHLAAEQYRSAVGFEAAHIPYKGGAPALVGLVGGDTTFMIAVTPEAMPLVKGGKLKALAVTTLERLQEFPDLPTVAETGVPGFEVVWGYGFVAPKGTPHEIVARLNAAFNRALEDPEVAGKLKGMGFEIAGGEPARLTQLMRRDRVKWKKIIEELDISVN